ncbi:MAG: thioredoxin family protein [Bacteroidota bacterium]
MKTILTWGLIAFTYCSWSQEYNKEIALEGNQPFMVGQINMEGLSKDPYHTWFASQMENYSVDDNLAKTFKENLKQYNITVFLGTWCGDSKREVPRFIKILKAADYPMEQLTMVALDRRREFYKKSPTGEEKGLNIIKVPTFIFYKSGEESNRIVESPIESLEEDILQIVMEKPYVPNYASAEKAH